jgi:hypothetical protein
LPSPGPFDGRVTDFKMAPYGAIAGAAALRFAADILRIFPLIEPNGQTRDRRGLPSRFPARQEMAQPEMPPGPGLPAIL